MTPVVTIHNLRHRPGPGFELAIDQLTLEPGRIHLAGPNGSGKTTLLRLVATLQEPDQGRIHLLNQPLPESLPAIRAQIGYQGHQPSLPKTLSARDALALHATLHNLPPDTADRALTRWNLNPIADQPIQTLSNGQQRRLDLARALLHQPRIVLLDEPTTGLDPPTQTQLQTHLDTLEPDLLLIANPNPLTLQTDRTLTLQNGHLTEEPP